MALGHLKAGVSPAQAVADLNSVGASLKKAYPKDDSDMTFTLARPSLYGDYIGRPMQTFHDGTDAPGRADPAGGVRQPGRLVCRTRSRPFAGDCPAPGARLEPQAHLARALYRSHSHWARRRRGWAPRQRDAVASAEHVAAGLQMAASHVGEPGCNRLCSCSAACCWRVACSLARFR